MSDLIGQLQSYGDQLEDVLAPYGIDFEIDDPASTPSGEGTVADPQTSGWPARWPWIAGLVVTSIVALIVLFALLSQGNSDRDDASTDRDDATSVTTAPELADTAPDDATEPDSGSVADDGPALSDTEPPADDPPTGGGLAPSDPAPAGSADSSAADSSAAEPTPCGIQEPPSSSDAPDSDAATDAEATLDTAGFTMRDDPAAATPLVIVDGGMSPCVDLGLNFTAGDTTPRVIELTIWFPTGGATYSWSYTRAAFDLEVLDVQGDLAIVRQVANPDGDVLVIDGAAFEGPPGGFGSAADPIVTDTILTRTNTEMGFVSSDPQRTQLGNDATLPAQPVGVGAVWMSRDGLTRYELVDITGRIATIEETADNSIGTTWIDLDEPLRNGGDYWFDYFDGGVWQRNHLMVNGPPCRRLETIPALRPFGGLTLGADLETIRERARCGLGDGAEESLDDPACSTISWGSLSLHFAQDGDQRIFVAWTYRLDDEGEALPGGPSADMFDFGDGVAVGKDTQMQDVADDLGVGLQILADTTIATGPAIEFASAPDEQWVQTVGVPAIPSC